MPGPHGQLRLPQHRIVLGVPQTGKTRFAYQLVRDARRLVVFDPTGDWADLPHAQHVRPPQLRDLSILRGDKVRVVVWGMRDEEYAVGDEVVFTVRACRAVGGLVLVFDETSLYNTGPPARALASLHMNGHKAGIVTVLVSQRAVGIPLDCRATATHVHCFLQDSEEDLTELRRVYDPGCPGFAERARAWQPYTPPVTWKRRELYPRSTRGPIRATLVAV